MSTCTMTELQERLGLPKHIVPEQVSFNRTKDGSLVVVIWSPDPRTEAARPMTTQQFLTDLATSPAEFPSEFSSTTDD